MKYISRFAVILSRHAAVRVTVSHQYLPLVDWLGSVLHGKLYQLPQHKTPLLGGYIHVCGEAQTTVAMLRLNCSFYVIAGAPNATPSSFRPQDVTSLLPDAFHHCLHTWALEILLLGEIADHLPEVWRLCRVQGFEILHDELADDLVPAVQRQTLRRKLHDGCTRFAGSLLLALMFRQRLREGWVQCVMLVLVVQEVGRRCCALTGFLHIRHRAALPPIDFQKNCQ